MKVSGTENPCFRSKSFKDLCRHWNELKMGIKEGLHQVTNAAKEALNRMIQKIYVIATGFRRIELIR